VRGFDPAGRDGERGGGSVGAAAAGCAVEWPRAGWRLPVTGGLQCALVGQRLATVAVAGRDRFVAGQRLAVAVVGPGCGRGDRQLAAAAAGSGGLAPAGWRQAAARLPGSGMTRGAAAPRGGKATVAGWPRRRLERAVSRAQPLRR